MTLINTILNSPKRNFTTTEEADICCHPQYILQSAQGYMQLEEDHLSTPVGDHLTPVCDNLYLIVWASDLNSEYGEISLFGSLSQALELFFNHK